MKGLIKTCVLLFVSLSIIGTVFEFSKRAVIEGEGKFLDYKIDTFTSFANGGMPYYKKHVYEPWRGRFFSTLAANGLMVLKHFRTVDLKQFSSAVASYHTIWFAAFVLLILVFVKCSPELKLALLIGSFACTMSSWIPAAENLVYPWDGPAMFFWMLVLILSGSRHRNYVPIIAAVGMGFKETLFLTFIIPLFWKDLSVNERIIRAFIWFSLCLLVKFSLDCVVGNPLPMFTMQSAYDNSPYNNGLGAGFMELARNNILIMFNSKWSNPALFGCGAWLIAMSWPGMPLMARILAIIYVPFLFKFGVITEARLFNEFVPIAVYGFSKMYGDKK